MTDELWPALPYDAWKDTYETLHMWTQVVGKVALAQEPPLNHSWAVALQVTPRGLTTRTLPHGNRSFTMQFDFIEHQLAIRASDGETRTLALRPQTVADFYREVMATLDAMGLAVKIWPMPMEIQPPTQIIRFDQDTVHASYDPVYANRFWRILTKVEPVLNEARCRFVGKCSPVHFFWGDERCVPPADAESNFGLGRRYLLDPLVIQPDKIHRVRGEIAPERAAEEAQAEICRIAAMNGAGQPVLDLIFLGMGEDGHVASLFPDAPDEVVRSQSVYLPVIASKPPPRRITINFAAIAAARQAWVLASGAGKEDALRRSLLSNGETPLSRVVQMREKTIIFTDVTI